MAKKRRKFFRRPGRVRREERINLEISAREVRIVGSEDDEKNGVFRTDQALRWAEELGVDVVEINAKQDPPLVKLIEYSKYKYEKKKKEKEAKARQHVTQMKEIRFGPNTDEHDFQFKLRHASKFLEEGNKVRAYVHFRGRSIVYKERGEKILLEFAHELIELGKVEVFPKLEGKRMHIIISPKNTKKKK